MSLLIKALDHLDKNKQAEKSKKLTGEFVADDALILELMPVEPKPEVETEQAIAENLAALEAVEVSEVQEVIERDLTLEEEAGLTSVHIAASKYAKPKPSVAHGSSAKVGVKATDNLLDKAIAKSSMQADSAKSSSSQSSKSNFAKNSTTAAKLTPAIQNPEAELSQKAAAKVFVANKAVKASSSKSALVILGVAGALLVWLGLQGYGYIKKLTSPDIVVVNPIVAKPAQPQVSPVEVTVIEAAQLPKVDVPIESAVTNQETQDAVNQAALDETATKLVNKTSAPTFENKVPENHLEKSGMLEDVNQAESTKSRANKKGNNNNEIYTDSVVSYNTEPRSNPKRKPLKLISKAATSGVDPTLMAAYQAFTRGNDVSAQQQYRQVLQRDVRNVDALLGMAAIAQRQGRDADSAGWYQKVLEIEPKNTIALSAIMGASNSNQQDTTDTVGAESRIKNMLAQHPDAANLHAALGNLYAEQGQWPSAQEAYFNASRLVPDNADYAFNLAISLDQMGKSNLALKQYERALDALNKSGGISPDRATLEARIRELQ
ncbi:MAG: tetratricopeptide repeat protein [Methylotenera sp.]|nr:tetratricopeptide repeat protein [Methylotenera sp.]